jgi:hypothetical protein
MCNYQKSLPQVGSHSPDGLLTIDVENQCGGFQYHACIAFSFFLY